MGIIVKGSTKRGQSLINRGLYYQGERLGHVYSSWSDAKQDAYDDCIDEYRNTPEHSNFRICSHNSNFFSVSWQGLYNGERAMFIKTGMNDYIILLDK